MKIAFILFTLILSGTEVSLTFSDLLFIYKNDINQSIIKLEKLGFEFNQTQKLDNGDEGIVWKYVNSEEKNNSLFVAKFCLKSNCGNVMVQTNNKEVYENLKEQAIENGFVYNSTEIGAYEPIDEIISIYYKDNFSLEISEGKYKDGTGKLYTINLSKLPN